MSVSLLLLVSLVLFSSIVVCLSTTHDSLTYCTVNAFSKCAPLFLSPYFAIQFVYFLESLSFAATCCISTTCFSNYLPCLVVSSLVCFILFAYVHVAFH